MKFSWKASAIGYVIGHIIITLWAPYGRTAPLPYKSVVQVLDAVPPTGGGTGFAVHIPGVGPGIITNSHVCQHNTNGYMYLHHPGTGTISGKKYIKVKVLKRHTLYDTCLLSGTTALKPIPLAYKSPSRGIIAYIGYPGLGKMVQSVGWIYGYGRGDVPNENVPLADCKGKGFFIIQGLCIIRHFMVHTTAKGAPGASGSPVFTKTGKVVGMVFTVTHCSNTVDYIPVNLVRAALWGAQR